MTDAFILDIVRRCAGDPDPATPKYRRLMNAVEDALSEGQLRPGERLPTEVEFANAVPFSLGTVQKALNGLVDRGLLFRSRRNGTFVADATKPLDDMSRFAFMRPDGSLVADVSTRMVECVPATVGRRLEHILEPSAGGYIRIVRIDTVDRAFACCSETHLSLDRFPDIASAPLEALSGRNLRPLLARRYGVSTARLEFATHANVLPARATLLLGLKPGAAGLELEITGRTASGEALFVQTLHIPASEYRVRIAESAAAA